MRKSTVGWLRAVGFFVITLAFTTIAAAQDSSGEQKDIVFTNESLSMSGRRVSQSDAALDMKNEFAVWGGFAPDIPRVFGGSRKSTFAEIGFRYSRRIATTENLAVKYQIDVIPVAILNYKRERILPGIVPGTFTVERPEQTAYAFGVTPVNFQLNFRRKSKIQPFITAEAGLLIFNKKIPDDRSILRPNQVGRRLNFTLAGGGGVEFLTDDARSYTVGFKFHHISNASTGNINPGFDQNLFYFGYTFKKW